MSLLEEQPASLASEPSLQPPLNSFETRSHVALYVPKARPELWLVRARRACLILPWVDLLVRSVGF